MGSAASLQGTRLSFDTQEEIRRRKKRCLKCLASFFLCFILTLSIVGILYNVVLNIKLDKTNLNLGNLKDNVETHREHLLQVSQDLRLMTEKLEIVEKDLENVKGVKKDLEFINEVKE